MDDGLEIESRNRGPVTDYNRGVYNFKWKNSL